MEPENIRFGGGVGATTLHPLFAVCLAAAILLLWLLPRKRAFIPLLFAVLLVPGSQIIHFGVHFMPLRIMVVAGLMRMVGTKMSGPGQLLWRRDPLDRWVVGWVIVGATTYTLLYMQSAAFINKAGGALDLIGGYYLLRFLIQGQEDALRVIKTLAAIAAIVALGMLAEQVLQVNAFRIPEGKSTPEWRDGHWRSAAAFGHPILAGSFGATLVPLFAYLWSLKARFRAFLAICCAVIIVMTTWSSGPLLALIGAFLALALWPLRGRMRLLRYGIVTVLIALQLVMKAPVWFMIERIAVVGASSGYHRAMLVDNFIRRFAEWWLIGTTTYHEWGWTMWDVSNGYVAVGLNGGLATLLCFIGILIGVFSAVGMSRVGAGPDRSLEWFYWCLGSAWFAHCVALFGTGYWDQSILAWLAVIATVAGTRQLVAESSPRRRPAKRMA